MVTPTAPVQQRTRWILPATARGCQFTGHVYSKYVNLLLVPSIYYKALDWPNKEKSVIKLTPPK